MATITATEVNKLRKMTGAGMMDCKKALVEANGDFEAAIDYLRKKGQKIAAKRADREATEGVIIATTSNDQSYGVVVHVSCETDFVAKNEDFVAFAQEIADLALKTKASCKDAFLNETFDSGLTVEQRLQEQVGKIGEKIEVSGLKLVEASTVVPYNHMNNKAGVLVGLNLSSSDELITVGKDVAMQIAAMKPVAVDESGVEVELLEKEKEIGKEKALAEGKPENIVDKIAEGYVKKFLKENTLLSQQFVKDGSKTVDQYLKSVDSNLEVTTFERLALN